jgi:hypothetical protein
MRIYFHRSPVTILNLIFVALFSFIVYSSSGQVWRAFVFSFSSTKVDGVVERIEWRKTNHRRSLPFHHFTFSDLNGEKKRGVTRYPSFFVTQKAGDTVPVGIRDADYEIVTFNNLWSAPSIIGLFISAGIYLIAKWCRDNIQITTRTP